MAISVGEFACGLHGDGAAVCWNRPGDQAHAIAAPLPFSSISVGGIACGILTDASAACWDPSATTAARVTGAIGITSLGAGHAHACAARTDGAVLCWGSNDVGQLGDNTHNPHADAEPVPALVSFATVAAGPDYSCALTSSGDTWCWGHIPWATQPYAFPIRSATNFRLRNLTLGTAHACAFDAETDAPVCWGDNSNGELGDGTTVSRLNPVAVDGAR
jgi:alpha-tubulin suppressor-like RCC1 family protein